MTAAGCSSAGDGDSLGRSTGLGDADGCGRTDVGGGGLGPLRSPAVHPTSIDPTTTTIPATRYISHPFPSERCTQTAHRTDVVDPAVHDRPERGRTVTGPAVVPA
jgi:hypothetical protein